MDGAPPVTDPVVVQTRQEAVEAAATAVDQVLAAASRSYSARFDADEVAETALAAGVAVVLAEVERRLRAEYVDHGELGRDFDRGIDASRAVLAELRSEWSR